MKKEKKILELLSRLDERLSAMEGGKVAKRQELAAPAKQSKAELICQKVKADIQRKQFVLLSRYGKGGSWTKAKQMLLRDREVRVICEGKTTIVMLRFGSPTAAPQLTAGTEKPAVRFVRRKRHQLQNPTRMHIEAIKAVLDTGKSLTLVKVAKLIKRSEARAYDFMKLVGKEQGYVLDRIDGHKKMLLHKAGTGAFHQRPMLKKSAYNLFMGDKLRYYQKKLGMDSHSAFMAAVADWNQRPHAHVESAPQRQFPAFQGVKPEYKPILIGVLEKLACRGTAVDYRGIAYALDIGTEAEYKALIQEIISNWEQVKAYFGVSANLVWDGKTLKLRD